MLLLFVWERRKHCWWFAFWYAVCMHAAFGSGPDQWVWSIRSEAMASEKMRRMDCKGIVSHGHQNATLWFISNTRQVFWISTAHRTATEFSVLGVHARKKKSVKNINNKTWPNVLYIVILIDISWFLLIIFAQMYYPTSNLPKREVWWPHSASDMDCTLVEETPSPCHIGSGAKWPAGKLFHIIWKSYNMIRINTTGVKIFICWPISVRI